MESFYTLSRPQNVKHNSLNTKKITILLDNEYHKIKFKIATRLKKDSNKPEFKSAHKRWVVQRTNSWFEKYRTLLKNTEKTIESSIAKI